MYISGNLSNFASRLHQLGTNPSAVDSFSTEGKNYASVAGLQTSGKWEREARASKFRYTRNPTDLFSPVFGAASSLTIPDAPILSGQILGFGPMRVQLDWNDVATETGYHIDRYNMDTAGPWAEIYSTGANVITWTDSVVPDGNYSYRIRASNAQGYSSYSNVVEIIGV